MVATISVLGKYSSKDGKPFDGEYFLGLVNPAYWLEGGEPAGRWYGRATEKLALSGEVCRESLQNLLKGLAPNGAPLSPQRLPRQKKLHDLKSRRRKHCPGFDLTISAPKSVSVLWAMANPMMRDRIERAFDIAVTTTLDWAEANLPLARRGKGGHSQEFGKLIVAMFDHSVSRVGKTGRYEPLLHRHNLILNVLERPDGTYGAINSFLLHKWIRTLGPMCRATLAELLSKDGLWLYRPLDRHRQSQSWFEIKGVPEKLCRHYSSRKNEMDELLETTVAGVKLGREHSTGAAREKANLETRRNKTKLPPRSELFAEWQKTAADFGLTERAARRLISKPRAVSPERAFDQAWLEAEAKLSQGQAHFSYRDALQRVCEAAQDLGVSGVWLAERLKIHLDQSREIIPLGEHHQEKQYTTRAMWELEKKFVAQVQALSDGLGPVVDPRCIDQVIDAKPTIAPDQAKAVRHLLSSEQQIRVMTGVAGAGKSFALDAVREGFERSGYRVLGGALAAVAKEELAEKAKIESRTVASYLYQLDKSKSQALKYHARHAAKQLVRALRGKKTFAQSKVKLTDRDVLIIDEAGMLDTKTLYRLCREVRRAGATIILVGDEKQLQPIAAGGSLNHIKGWLHSAHLTTNMRQKDPLDREASTAIREGRAEAALQNLVKRDRVIVKKDKKATITQLVKDWTQYGGAKEPTRHVVFTQTREESKILNRLCQAQRIGQGLITPSQHIVLNGEKLCRGDRILFHKAQFKDGIANGYRGTVIQANRTLGRLTVELDSRNDQPPRMVTIHTRDYGSDGITLAYSQTTHKGQGQSCEHTYMLLGGSMTDREMAYVQATRGKLSTRLYVDEAHAGHELKDLARAMSRSRAKLMAHDLPIVKPKPEHTLHIERRLEP